MTQTLQEQLFIEQRKKELLQQAHDYAAAFIDAGAEQPAFPGEQAIAGLSVFDEPVPEAGLSGANVIDKLAHYGGPATAAQQGGRYFGFVNGGALPTALAARWLADVWDQNSAVFNTSPIASKLESVSEKWVTELLGLPSNTVAGFVTGSSSAIFCGLAAARWRLLKQLGWDVNTDGLAGAPQLRIITGRQTHATVVKAVALLGFGTANIEFVDVDSQGRLIAEKMPVLDDKSIVCLQAGNVASGSFDPFESICQQARDVGAWVHVDGAFGLWAAASENYRGLTKGMELAHSWSVDGHKTLNTPYDCGLALCADAEALEKALQASGSYIVRGKDRDGMNYTPDMSRRARSIDLWAALAYLGKDGVDQLIDLLCSRAREMASALEVEGFRILNDVVFNQVLVACETEEATKATIADVQASGVCWAGTTNWFGETVIRVSVCNWATTSEDIALSTKAFVDARARASKG
ncbi:MAG: aspartate aminotransferase family protein [Kordiimonadaceae bacterium]|nr:aspartate aminotransferase family protein [Kordiimonadaceae bacterium]MBO6568168.1 aspartate aminotransferase family protein [Kordiimonadaceae bacterium]MBO6964102.1 aspartate aminotransferase family protein [Kordiimonadaceae bacterium]